MGRGPCWSQGRTKQPHGEQGAPGTGHPTAPHPSSSSSSPWGHSIPWGKPGGRLKACRNLHKALPEVAEQQQDSRDAVRPVSSTCCTCCSKVGHGSCFHFSRTQALQREVLLSALQASLVGLSIMIPKLAFHTLASR